MIDITITRDGVSATIEIGDGQPVEIHVAALELLGVLAASSPATAEETYEEPVEEEADDVEDEIATQDVEDEPDDEPDLVEPDVPTAAAVVDRATRSPRPAFVEPTNLECDECDKTFAKRGSLAQHKRVMHSGVTLHCDIEGCYFTTGAQNMLAMHRRNQHGGPKLAPVVPGTSPLHERTGPIDIDAARARAADAAFPNKDAEAFTVRH